MRHSVVMKKDSTCVIVDYDPCLQNNDAVFDYSKYCEMQNGLMASSGRLFRFYAAEGEDLLESIHKWLTMEPDDIELSDKGGVFDKVHVDNTPLEKTFEDLFVETYGNDALGFLQKEYSLSLSNGRNAFRNAHFIKGTRPFALYAHQETFLQEMSDARARDQHVSCRGAHRDGEIADCDRVYILVLQRGQNRSRPGNGIFHKDQGGLGGQAGTFPRQA